MLPLKTLIFLSFQHLIYPFSAKKNEENNQKQHVDTISLMFTGKNFQISVYVEQKYCTYEDVSFFSAMNKTPLYTRPIVLLLLHFYQ